MGPLGALGSGRTLCTSWHSRFAIELYFALLPSAEDAGAAYWYGMEVAMLAGTTTS